MRKTALSFMVLPFFFGASLACAEDSLNLFQNDIVGLKQKQEAARLALQAQGMMQELVVPDYSFGPDNLKVLSSPEPVIRPRKRPKAVSLPSIKKEPLTKKPGFMPYREKKQPTQGELLYKVAVSDGVVTAGEAVEIALANHLQIQAAAKKVEVARAKVVEAKRAMFPTVQASVIWGAGGKQPISAENGVENQGGTNPTNTGYRIFESKSRKINVSQPLYYGGELTLTVKQAEENVKVAEEEFKKVKNELAHQTRISYYAAVKAEYNVQFQEELYDKADVIYQKVIAARRERVIPEVEYLNAESLYEQVYFQAEAAENERVATSMTLHQALNLDTDQPLPVEVKLDLKKINPSIDDLLEIAYNSNPDYLSKEFAMRSAKHAVEIYQAKKRPHFDLKGSYGMVGEDFTLDDATTRTNVGRNEVDFSEGKEWFLGVKGAMPLGPNSIEYENVKHVFGPSILSPTAGSEDWSNKLTFNLFDKLSDITDEKSAQATMLQVGAETEKAKNEMVLNLREGLYNMQKSLVQVDSATAKIRYHERQNAILEYLVGIQESQVPNLLEGYIDLAQARFALIQATADYNVALSGIGTAMGEPDYFNDQLGKS